MPGAINNAPDRDVADGKGQWATDAAEAPTDRWRAPAAEDLDGRGERLQRPAAVTS